jgi:hypothetical protein
MDELWFTIESLIQNQEYSELEKAWFAKGEELSQETIAEIMFDAFFAGVPLSN